MEQMILRAKRIRAAAGEAMTALLRGSMVLSSLASGAAAAILAVYTTAEGIAPFGLGCAIGVWYAGVSPYFALLGAGSVYLIKANFAYAAAAAFIAAGVYAVERFITVRRVYRLLIGFGIDAAVLCIASAIAGSPALLAMGSASVTTLVAVVLGHSLKAMSLLPARSELTDTELISLAAGAGLLTVSIGNFSVLGQSPAMVFAGVCALVSAYRFGISSVAFVVAIGAGRAMVTGGDMHFMAVIAASALIASTVRSIGKWAVLIAFLIVDLLFAVFMQGTGILSVPESLLSSLVFALLPVSLYTPSANENERSGYRRDTRYNTLQYRVSGLADVLRELARVFGTEGTLLACISDTLSRMVSGSASGKAHYNVISGCAASKKQNSPRSGDNCCVRSVNGSQLLCISDGMGSGDEAYFESRETLALLCDLLTVGFDLRSAADCINKLLTRRAKNDMYATLDALLFDLSDGSAGILKLGAPPSYVVRQGKLYSLYAENLPIGIIEEAESPVRRVALKRGDIIVMLTDGAADALGSRLMQCIVDITASSADIEEAAREILEMAQETGSSDDMTVLTAKVV